MKYLLKLLPIALLLFTGCDIQRKILYYPGQFQFQDIRQAVLGNDMVLWPQDSSYYLGIMSATKQFSYKGTIIIFHGNAGPAVFRKYYIDALEKSGYRVILAEYPGYGGKPGKMTESNIVFGAKKLVKLAKEQFGDPIYLWGESMGCWVVAALAGDADVSARGVIMLTPWDNLTNVAKDKLSPSISSSAGLLVKDKYDSVNNISKYRGPVAVIMA
ncbi:MAG: alpha/beta fold hydrolase, partial [bacterium]|nr:alpha/beta fold hydrolase [bacterium]